MGDKTMPGNRAEDWPIISPAIALAPPTQSFKETAMRKTRDEANRLLARLEGVEHKIPHSDFVFVADCHDPERRITESRLAKLRIIAEVYAK